MRFNNKVAVVTGAAQGIGAAIAKRLYTEGAVVVLLDMSEDKLKAVAGEIDRTGEKAFAHICNVADKDQVNQVFGEIEAKFGKIDILINNAGITRDAMLHKMEEEQWDAVIDVNLKGIFNCCKAVVPGMRDRKYGKIVNLASVSAFGNIGQTNYGASKGGVIGFTKCLAKEIARNNCTVNCIAPSYVNTEMLQAVPENVMQKFLAAIPMNRLGEPEELAAVAAFLSSDDSSFVTGECIVVSGGSYM
ncbi:3-oxoacyl-ACP reductase FabG [Anaerocolumna sedimenticola]|uniref:3-oxoacyl-ACP reductase FabG n=1 Tax=Anaerocolumna sedimenticola TaxID=2696063 RepID=A0A6P1TH77_9FIRM|nr:3-oxoacyl-ACP reductase FabG [Anaerocolumna sedimenticola]QHQ59657.1 3-oxoacyl-ACP reductase FabG [Anaerocolumna sedimenticola]